ncbi:MAG: hypothetical protein M0P12_03135 [Paludibacteraceae bacterium]|nr:hypothetical protein [Paludibacteraceae bacterium]MCK9615924.1 hypothetical protein [Candidatus Omnitrophota bacterium]
MKKGTLKIANNPDLDTAYCPLPVTVITNMMGINLCSVKRIDWRKQDDGQLVDLTIYFDPFPKEV